MQSMKSKLDHKLGLEDTSSKLDPSLQRLVIDLNLPNKLSLHLSLNNLVFHKTSLYKRRRVEPVDEDSEGADLDQEQYAEPKFIPPLDLKLQCPCCFHALQRRHQQILLQESRVPTIYARSHEQKNREHGWDSDHAMYDPLVRCLPPPPPLSLPFLGLF